MKALLYADWLQFKKVLWVLFPLYAFAAAAINWQSQLLFILWSALIPLSTFWANQNNNWLVYSQMLPFSARARVLRRYIFVYAIILPFPVLRLLFLFFKGLPASGYLSVGMPTAFLMIFFSICLPIAFILQEELNYWPTLALGLFVAGGFSVLYYAAFLKLPLPDLAIAGVMLAVGAVCTLISIPVSIRFCRRWS